MTALGEAEGCRRRTSLSALRKGGGRRMLVVIDHAHSTAQVRWLLPAAAGCAVLVTSRRRMIDLAGAHLVEIDALSPGEALHLFTRIVDEPEAARYVVDACGFVPLAIRIAASRLAARPTWRIATLADRLADDTNRLAELQTGDLAITPSSRAYPCRPGCRTGARLPAAEHDHRFAPVPAPGGTPAQPRLRTDRNADRTPGLSGSTPPVRRSR